MMDFHIPVMVNQVLASLIVNRKGIYVDCTLGGGGHSKEILKEIYPDGLLIGLDQDVAALEFAREYLKDYQDSTMIIKSNFAELEFLIKDLGFTQVSGVLYDLGLSSHQVDAQSRGFSFQGDDLLDMRMDLSKQFDARYVVNHYSEGELWDIFSRYGEERFSRSIARAIAEERTKKAIDTTGHLASIITGVYKRYQKGRWHIHPATRVFQALRIEVNGELEILEKSLRQAINLLEPNGRIVAITYHSLEDRIVKKTFKELAEEDTIDTHGYKLRVLTKKPIYPSEDEIRENHRARSAKMRVAEKIS